MVKESGQYTTILWNGYDLSGDLNQYDITFEHVEDDATGFMDALDNILAGIYKVSGSFMSMMNDDTGQAHDVLKAPTSNEDILFCILIGGEDTPAIGDSALQALITQFTYTPKPTAKTLILGDVAFSGGQSNVKANPNAFILAFTTITATTNFSSRDNGASSSNGGVAVLQVITATSTDTYVVKCQDSPNDSTWADLCTFSADGTSITAERQTFSGSVDQYERAIATRTGSAGDSFKLAVTMARL